MTIYHAQFLLRTVGHTDGRSFYVTLLFVFVLNTKVMMHMIRNEGVLF